MAGASADYVYKVADGCPISLRIWPSSAAASPIMFWIHGGGWICGARYTVNPWVLKSFREVGYTFVSVDYRLMPQVLLGDILEDVLDAYTWVQTYINSQISPASADVDCIVVGGDSAGATMAALLGVKAQPMPKAVLNLYGVMDFTRPPRLNYPHPTEDSPGSPRNSDGKLAAIIANPKLAPVLTNCPSDPNSPRYATVDTPPGFVFTERMWLQSDLKAYFLRNGGLVQSLFAFECGSHEDAFVDAAKQLSVLNLLKDIKTYPPTYIIHGTADKLVEVIQAEALVNALDEKGVPVTFARIQDGEHGCDEAWDDKSADDWDWQIKQVMEFMAHHVRA